MEVEANLKYVRMSPGKGRDLARNASGLAVAEALRMFDLNSRKASFHIGKALKSAIANAENNAEIPVESLRVRKIVIDDGPMIKRYRPRARGGAGGILKRTCHIKVVLTDGVEEEADAVSGGGAG